MISNLRNLIDNIIADLFNTVTTLCNTTSSVFIGLSKGGGGVLI